MYWKVNIQDRNHIVELPSSIPDNTPFKVRVNEKIVTLRWQRSTRCLYMLENERSSVWKSINIRTSHISKFQGDNDSIVYAEFVAPSHKSVISVECALGIYVPGQEARVSGSAKKPRLLRSQITGKVIKVLNKPGDRVATGDVLLIIEAMKMENRVTANVSGTIDKLSIKEGDTVSIGAELVRFKPD